MVPDGVSMRYDPASVAVATLRLVATAADAVPSRRVCGEGYLPGIDPSAEGEMEWEGAARLDSFAVSQGWRGSR